MTRSADAPTPGLREPDRLSYWRAAQQPLQILLFVLPLIIAEFILALVLPSASGVLARETLLRFFEVFGVSSSAGLYLGGLVIIAVLLAWQVLARRPWRVDPALAGLMALESLILAVPLLVFGRLLAESVADPAVAALTAPTAPVELSLWQGLAVSLGAGLYEELLFRMLLIAVVHGLIVDVAGLPHAVGVLVAVLVSAVAFTLYHPLETQPGSGVLSARRIAFYLLAGLYLGTVYATRGFGIVVGVHALYDILTVIMLGEPDPA